MVSEIKFALLKVLSIDSSVSLVETAICLCCIRTEHIALVDTPLNIVFRRLYILEVNRSNCTLTILQCERPIIDVECALVHRVGSEEELTGITVGLGNVAFVELDELSASDVRSIQEITLRVYVVVLTSCGELLDVGLVVTEESSQHLNVHTRKIDCTDGIVNSLVNGNLSNHSSSEKFCNLADNFLNCCQTSIDSLHVVLDVVNVSRKRSNLRLNSCQTALQVVYVALKLCNLTLDRCYVTFDIVQL